ALIDSVDSRDATAAVRERALATLESVLAPNANQVAMMEGGPVGPRTVPGGAGTFSGTFSGVTGVGYPIVTPQAMSIASWVIAPAARASTDPSPAVRRAAVRVLGAASNMVADPAIAPALGAALKDEDSTVRRIAAQAMVNVARFTPE